MFELMRFIKTGMCIRAFPTPDLIHGVSVSSDGLRVAMGGDDCRLEVFDMDSQECLRSWPQNKKVGTKFLK